LSSSCAQILGPSDRRTFLNVGPSESRPSDSRRTVLRTSIDDSNSDSQRPGVPSRFGGSPAWGVAWRSVSCRGVDVGVGVGVKDSDGSVEWESALREQRSTT
jgi:hypothetical protein